MNTDRKISVDWSTIDWAEVMPRLLRYAVSLLRRKDWRGEIGSGGSGVYGAEDIVQTAILKTMSGRRPWNPEGDVDIFLHLAGTVRSEVSNLSTSSDNRLVKRMPENFAEVNAGDTPDVSINFDHRMELVQLLKFIKDRDPNLKNLLAAMLVNDGASTKELSCTLNVSEKEIWNMKKRLRRVVAEYQSNKEENYYVG